jgi:hypothetical protein
MMAGATHTTIMTHTLSRVSSLCLIALATATVQSQAATMAVNGGSMSLDLDSSIFSALFLTTNDHFGATSSNSLTLATITNPATPGDTTDVWTGLPFGVNPASISSPSGRTLPGTTLTYDPGNLTGTAAGQIGLGGFTRFNGAGGLFYIGDYQLLYNATRATGVYSGWYLQNTAGFPANAFDFANVSTNVTGSGFTLSGDLVPNSDSFFSLYGLTGTDMGNFSFTATAVPETSSAFLGTLSMVGLLTRRRRTA